MRIVPFLLERYFARHEFSARWLLSCSDCEPLSLGELLALASRETRALWDALKLGYTESPGHPRLRAAVAELYAGCGPDDVLTVVPEEGIFLLMHALVEPGAHVVCISPAYQSLHEVARSLGAEIGLWEPDESSSWRFEPARLEGLLRDDTRLVVVNFPHNPTGALLSREDYAAVVELVTGRGIHLLSDEMYRFLEPDEQARLPAGCELSARALALGGLSKSFGLPGLRVGWVVTRDRDLLGRMAALKDYTTICGSAPSEILALMALENREAITASQRLRVRRNLGLLDRFFAEHAAALAWSRPAAGSVGFPRLVAHTDAEGFCARLLEETGILLVPATLFGHGNRHVRIGFGREDLPEVLARFGEWLQSWSGSV